MTGRATSALVDAWTTFWFRSVSRDIYAVLRIAFAAVGLISVLGLLPVETFWTPQGLMPLPGGGFGVRGYIVTHGLGAAVGVGLFSLLVGSFLCMLVGYRTQMAIVVALIGTAAQSFWNSLPLAGGNEVLGIVLFGLVWADCAGWPSVDAWRASRHGEPRHTQEELWPLRLIQIQVAFIYFNSACWKLLGPTWRDGSTIHYVLNLNTFQRFPFVLPVEWHWLTTLATYLTLVWEITFPFMLLHRRTRIVALIAGIGVHLGLWATLELGPFSFVMLASYLAFADPDSVSRLIARRFTPDAGTRRSAEVGARPLSPS